MLKAMTQQTRKIHEKICSRSPTAGYLAVAIARTLSASIFEDQNEVITFA